MGVEAFSRFLGQQWGGARRGAPLNTKKFQMKEHMLRGLALPQGSDSSRNTPTRLLLIPELPDPCHSPHSHLAASSNQLVQMPVLPAHKCHLPWLSMQELLPPQIKVPMNSKSGIAKVMSQQRLHWKRRSFWDTFVSISVRKKDGVYNGSKILMLVNKQFGEKVWTFSLNQPIFS